MKSSLRYGALIIAFAFIGISKASAQQFNIGGYLKKTAIIREVDYHIDKAKDLQVEFQLNLFNEIPSNEDQMDFTSAVISDLRMYIWSDSILTPTAADPFIQHRTQRNTLISSIRWSDIGEPSFGEGENNILFNKNWGKIEFALEYTLESKRYRTARIPIYAAKSTIPWIRSEDRPGPPTLKSISSTRGTNTMSFQFESDRNENLEIEGIEIEYDDNSYSLKAQKENLFLRGNIHSINAEFDLSDLNLESLPEGKYKVILKYKNDNTTPNASTSSYYPFLKLTNSFESAEPDWAGHSPNEQNLITIRKHEKLNFSVKTNGRRGVGWDLESGEVNVKIVDPSDNISEKKFPSKLDSDGTATFALDIENLPDGIYLMFLSGTITDDERVSDLVLPVSQYYLLKDTRNSIKNLTYYQEGGQLHFRFELENEEAGDCSTYILSEGNGKSFLNIASDEEDESKIYHRTIALSQLPKNEFITVKFAINRNEFFSFKFFVRDEEELIKLVSKNINDEIERSGINKEDRGDVINLLGNLKANKSFINQLVASTTDSIVADSDQNSIEFEKELTHLFERQLDAWLVEARERSKASFKENSEKFFSTPVGGVVKTIGSFALRYFGIVIA